tara:strand:+ start:373 stop:966 length:594 start_codon:yes stop_codon:yes gene_type:complete
MNFNLNASQATVISSLILTTGITGAIISLNNDTNSIPKNYATVNYDGGYTKIGIIYDENIYSKAKVEYQGSIQSQGDFETVKSYLIQAISKDKTAETTDLLPGVKISASTGIEWNGTRKSFKLETESFSETSTKEDKLNVGEIINKFDKMLNKTERNRKKTSKSSLVFDVDPDPSATNEWSSLLGQIINLVEENLPY